jgi:ABC-2 type transport system ATP-binding protein
MGQTVWQNMMNSAIKWNIQNAEEKTEGILKHLNLYGRKDLSAKNLSGGQLKLLSIGMELMRDPPILLLDEPTTGLDPTSRGQIISVLSRLVTHFKRTVIMSSHFMDELDECDLVGIIKGGKLITIGSPADLKRKMPGGGKVVSISLERVTDELIKKLSELVEVKKVISEGRTLKVLMDSPNPVLIGQKISGFGGFVEEARIDKATMKEVFIYYTGARLED